jgi:hypothetical protein
METLRQGISLFSAILLVVGTIVVVQLWLVAAALDAFLVGDTAVLVPATIGSFVLFLVNAGLVRYVVGFDRRWRRSRTHDRG